MTRCPNCGSAIRIGAKFCTSCGFRLTTEAPSSAPAAGSSRSPFATTSSPAWSADPPIAGEPRDVAVSEVVEVEPAWTRASGDGDILSVEIYSGATTPGRTDGAPTAPDDSAVDSSAVDDNDQPGLSWYAPPAQDTSGPVSDDMIASLDPDPGDASGRSSLPAADASAQAADSLAADVAAGGSTSVAEAEAATFGTETTDTIGVGVAGTGETTGASTSSGDRATARPDQAADPLAEARALAARLTEVLATVPVPDNAARTSGPVVSSVANEADVQALRTVVAAAQERPRDVDVMLDLVLRAETIGAVLTDRDLLLAALRGDEAAVEEAFSSDSPASSRASASSGSSGSSDDEPSTYPAWRELP